MPHFGEKSRAQYMTLDERLQDILDAAIHVMNFSIIEGYRDEKTQNKYYKKGASKLKYPMSNHNVIPSLAVDIAPWKNGIDWEDLESFAHLAGIIKGIAFSKGVKIRWGGDFETFKDMPHFELRI